MTVIRQADSWFIRERSPHYTSFTVKLGDTKFDLNIFEQMVCHVLDGRRIGLVVGSLVQIRELVSILRSAHRDTRTMLSIMLYDWALMAELKDSSCDLMLTDPGIPAGIILVPFLNLPMVYIVRWMSFGEGHFSTPPLLSLMCLYQGLTDNMSILQRTQNLIHYINLCLYLQGELRSDCLFVTFFNICSWCQMAREIKRRHQPLTVITFENGGQAGLITMAANMTVHQQVAAPSIKGWKSGLFDSFQDMSVCCNEFWCCPCYASSTTGEFGESTYLPLMDIIGPAFMVAIGVPIIVPPASLSMRVAIRHKYGIQGSLFEDILTSCFCACCSWCQMAREIKEHKKGCTFITTQPVAIQVQPQTCPT
ncbi:hypothetical protein J4Q44_G00242060 [Coregonus suidteri]|uniref:Uncharacterized protein n=1 Tax=Coregonus suidteri TaxID=861788 RepID=A0AAN8LL32_9TELE